YIDAFRALGINVVEVFINELGTDSLDEKAQILGQRFRESTPMFVFSINYFPYISIVCQGLSLKYVSLSVTCPMIEIYNRTIKNSCNRVFLFDRQQYESVKDENPEGIFHLPLGAAVERMDTLLGETCDYKYDISFVGSLYNEKDPFLKLDMSSEKREYFEAVMNRQIDEKAWGQELLEESVSERDVEDIKAAASDFYPSHMSVMDLDRFVAVNNYLSPHMTYIERVMILNMLGERFGQEGIHFFTQSDVSLLHDVSCHGGVNTMDEMPFVFRQSKVNLNTSTRSIQTGIPQRVWDVLACRGFLITNYQEEIPLFLEPGNDLAVYRDDKELPELIEYYLTHDDEREAIACAGYNKVKQQGSVLFRVLEIIRKIA
ncbi:MAG: DUF3880 domain-containing protein, partial [Butyrivibrio sp.]|nr:DUF3880 domain-containing protein [Butyrivibrio sp.]